MMKLFSAVFLAAVMMTASISVGAVEYRIVDLGTPEDAYVSTLAINDIGQVVGSTYNSSGNKHSFLWQNGTRTSLGQRQANDINNSGQIAWDSSVGINDNGDTTGWYWANVGSTRTQQACLLKDRATTELGTLGGTSSFSRRINNSGQIVGYSTLSNGYMHPFLWENGEMKDLGSLSGDYYANRYNMATDINDIGQIIGLSYMPNGSQCPFLWKSGVMTPLSNISSASGINNNGQIVGSFSLSNGQSHACLLQDGAIIDLGTLGGVSSSAWGINNNGWIVGMSADASGDGHVVLWQPVPEPASILSLICGIAVLGGTIVRRKNK